jgi:hypothetical protein
MKRASITEARNNLRLARLVRQGTVRPGRTNLSRSLLADQPPRPKGGASAVAVLISERRAGR